MLQITKGAQATITAPDKSSSYDLQIGYNKGADNNTLRVLGIGSALTVNTSTIYTGYNGNNNSLEILEGGSVSTLQMRIGGGSGSTAGSTPSNNVVRVDGTGSTLIVLGTVNLGASSKGGAIGSNNRLEITNGGQAALGLTNSKNLAIGHDSGSNNNLALVTGKGSTLNAYNIEVGNGFNKGNTLTIGNGAQVNTGSIAFRNNSVYAYGIGGEQTALATSATAITIDSNVYVKPYISPQSSVQRHNAILKLMTGGASGTFAGLDTSELPSGFFAELLVSSNQFDLNLTAGLGQGISLNQNQSNVAQGINQAFNNGSSLPEVFTQLFTDYTSSTLGQKLTLLSGEAATGAQQTALQSGSGFLSMISGAGPWGAGRDQQQRSKTSRSSLWIDGFGGYSILNGSTSIGSHDMTIQGGGAVLGVDQRLNKTTLVGAAIGWVGSSWGLDAGLGGGTSQGLQLGLYSQHSIGAGYLNAGLGYGNFWLNTSRSDGAQTLTAQSTAWTLSGRVEGGYRFTTSKRSGLTPFTALVVQHYGSPQYSETGSPYALTYQSSAITDPTTELGLRFDANLDRTTLFFKAAWLHDFNPQASMTASFLNLQGSSFTVNGAARANDAALLSAGVDWAVNPKLALKAELNGALSAQQMGYGGALRLRFIW